VANAHALAGGVITVTRASPDRMDPVRVNLLVVRNMSIVDRPAPMSPTVPGCSCGCKTRSTHRGDQLVRPLALPEAALSPAELFLPTAEGHTLPRVLLIGDSTR